MWLFHLSGNVVPVVTFPLFPHQKIPCNPIISAHQACSLHYFRYIRMRFQCPYPTRSLLVGTNATVSKVIFFSRACFAIMNLITPSRPAQSALNAPYTHNRAVVCALGNSGANIDMAIRGDALLPNQYSVAKKNVKMWCGRNIIVPQSERSSFKRTHNKLDFKSGQYVRAMTKIAREPPDLRSFYG